MYIFVSEFGQDQTIEIVDPLTHVSYKFTLESERSVLFATDMQGQILKVYRDERVFVGTNA